MQHDNRGGTFTGNPPVGGYSLYPHRELYRHRLKHRLKIDRTAFFVYYFRQFRVGGRVHRLDQRRTMEEITMTDAPAPQNAPEHHEEERHNRFVMLVYRFPTHMHRALIFASWIFPVVMIGAGYLFFPSLRGYVGSDVPDALGWGLVFQLSLMIAYLVWEWLYASYRNTGVAELQWDAAISTAEAIILTAIFGIFIAEGLLFWAFIVPWMGSMADAFLTSTLAINNAAQKPSFPLKAGT